MRYRPLGRTGIQVSELGFGCGNVGGLMTLGEPEEQRLAVARALEAGITYFDTAPSYGDGRSEVSLGRALAALGAWDRVHVGTKVGLTAADLADPGAALRASIQASLSRLGRDSIDLLQLHSRIGSDGGRALSAARISLGSAFAVTPTHTNRGCSATARSGGSRCFFAYCSRSTPCPITVIFSAGTPRCSQRKRANEWPIVTTASESA